MERPTPNLLSKNFNYLVKNYDRAKVVSTVVVLVLVTVLVRVLLKSIEISSFVRLINVVAMLSIDTVTSHLVAPGIVVVGGRVSTVITLVTDP